MVFSVSPILVSAKASLAVKPSFSRTAMVALDSFAFGPSSQTIGNASSATLARHQLSATTATVVLSTLTTRFTPRIFSTLPSSKLTRGYGVPRYVSVEQRIFESKNAYYDALYGSQREWHEGTHSVWPWIEYLAGVLADAYALLEQRVAAGAGTRRLSKQQRVRVWVLDQAPARFRFREIRRAVPGVSDATIKLVLGELRNAGLIEAERGGSQSEWRRL